jgi:hypothetical protein
MMSIFRGNFWKLCAVFSLIASVSAPATFAQAECHSAGAPISQSGDISLADTVQPTRLFRDGRGTTCLFSRPATTSAVSVNADQYTFTNSTGAPQCVTIDLDATGCGVATNQISLAVYSPTYTPATPAVNVIGDPGLSTGQNFQTTVTFPVAAGATYIVVVHTVNNATTCPSYTFRRYIMNNCRSAGFDRANDGSSDYALFRPSGGLAFFYSAPVNGGAVVSTQLGSAGDIPVPGDYNGDEATDVAVFRPSNGTWYTSTNPATNYGAKLFGLSTDIPVQGDYDRDGITDIAVYRPSTGEWFVLRSSTNSMITYPPIGGFFQAGDKAIPADYDGDNQMDLAVWRASSGQFITRLSSGAYNSPNFINFGLSTDLPVPADYDGDGKADVAVFRPSDGVWYIFRTSVTTGQVIGNQFGANGDIPQPADYDGDRKADQAIYRPSTNTWFIRRSTSGDTGAFFGQASDIPVSRPNNVN